MLVTITFVGTKSGYLIWTSRNEREKEIQLYYKSHYKFFLIRIEFNYQVLINLLLLILINILIDFWWNTFFKHIHL